MFGMRLQYIQQNKTENFDYLKKLKLVKKRESYMLSDLHDISPKLKETISFFFLNWMLPADSTKFR